MKGKARKKRIAHIVSHTHWDREWRYPIWETRLMLMDFMDELIRVLESGAYPGFLMDGQVSPVYDYLEVRPEMTARVKALVQSGKLQVGPWWILPDEYPIDGESFVRNLLWGQRRSAALGKVFNVGYTSFGWGQTAQLPQIYAGFGIDTAMIGKRVAHQRAPQCEFVWRGPDGTELLATRFGALGRQNFYFKVHLSALFGVDHEGPDWSYSWAQGGIAYHRADSEQMEQDHFRLDPPMSWHPETITPEMIEAVWATMEESVLEEDRLMMNGCDYTASQPMFPEMVTRLNEVDPDPDRQWIHTTMPEFLRVMKRKVDRRKLVVVEGELRDGPAGAVTGNALTTRLYLKRLNKQAQNALIRFAEPLAALAAMAGAPHQTELVQRAWDFLLASHPHDSINGVTQDKTANDVEGRLHQVLDLAQTIGNRAMQELIHRIDMSIFRDEDVLLVAFNPLPYARREVAEAWINLPKPPPATSWPPDPGEAQVFDADGNPLGTQWCGATTERYCVAELHTRAFPFDCERHHIFFDTGEVPAGGYKVFRVGTMSEARTKHAPWADSQARSGTLLAAPNILENELLRVEMNGNGTFNILDKLGGAAFNGLNYFEDRGEHGDYWINKRPMHDRAINSLGCAARLWSIDSGPLHATLVSEVTLVLPVRGNKELQQRGEEEAPLTLRTAVTLAAGSPQVDVQVDFENRHEDHYLRVLFPTGLAHAAHADAAGHFTVDRRPIRPQGPTPNSVWPDMGTLPQGNFVDVSDGKRGIAFINESLTEYEVLDNPERTVALSLLRAVRNWLCTETRVGSGFPSQKGGQCLGAHRIRYAIRPHAGDWHAAGIPRAADNFNAPMRFVQTRAHDGSLPEKRASLFAIENPVARFSALKKAEDRDTWILRLFNPTDSRQETRIRFGFPLAGAWLTDLNEKRASKLDVLEKNCIALAIDACKIVTIEFAPR